MSAALDADGQPRNTGFNLVNNELKAVNTLYGLCMGVVADGVPVMILSEKDWVGFV